MREENQINLQGNSQRYGLIPGKGTLVKREVGALFRSVMVNQIEQIYEQAILSNSRTS